jgi:outer membrane scaffolding protein for murein synthesis (MipA/OmpV family)
MTRLPLLLMLLVPVLAVAQDDYVLLGAGLRLRPAYDGSDAQRIDLIPVVRYYGRALFARTTQGILEGGARMRLAPGWDAGVQLAYEAGRQKSESGRLRALDVPDLDWTASGGLHLETDQKVGPMPLNVLARTRHSLDSERGSQVDLRATGGVYERGGLQAGVFAQATWASRKYLSSFYTGGNSGGALFASLGALASSSVRRDWLVLGSAELRRLHGDAARSPITETRDNYYANAALAYRF